MGQPGKVANPAWSGEQKKCTKYFPRSPFAPDMRIWSRETGSADLPRALILHTQAESGAYSLGSPPAFRGGVHSLRINPEFMRSRNGKRMAFTVESPPVQGQ